VTLCAGYFRHFLKSAIGRNMKPKESRIVLTVFLEHAGGDRNSRPHDVVILGGLARRVVSTARLFKDSIVPPACRFGRLFLPELVADASTME
jgi:hypothetical protein